MKNVLLALAVLSCFSVSTNAVVNAGDNEIAFFGTYTNIDSEDNGRDESAFAFANLGHFLTDNLELGLLGMGTWAEENDIYSAGVNARWHFLTDGPITPYLGAFGMFGYNDDNGSDTGWIYGPAVGVRFFVNDTTNVFLEYQYQLYEGDLGDSIDNEQLILGGISFLF